MGDSSHTSLMGCLLILGCAEMVLQVHRSQPGREEIGNRLMEAGHEEALVSSCFGLCGRWPTRAKARAGCAPSGTVDTAIIVL